MNLEVGSTIDMLGCALQGFLFCHLFLYLQVNVFGIFSIVNVSFGHISVRFYVYIISP